jgi:hypothetical protein
MQRPLTHILVPYAVSAALCGAGAVALQLKFPAFLSFLDDMLTTHTVMFGAWLALAAAGADFAIVTFHRKLRLGEVGAKSAAQLHISRR